MSSVLVLYPDMVESIITTKILAKKLLDENNRKSYLDGENALKIEHSFLFKLRKDTKTGRKYCCLLSQSLSDRMYEKTQYPHKAPWDDEDAQS